MLLMCLSLYFVVVVVSVGGDDDSDSDGVVAGGVANSSVDVGVVGVAAIADIPCYYHMIG